MPQLSGCRVLIVEDEYFLADDAAQALRDAGAEIVGPVPGLEEAMEQVEADGFDVALLDIKLDDEAVYPVADMLSERGIPFAFVTGYDQSHIPQRFRDVPYQVKPHGAVELVPLLERLRSAIRKAA